MLYCLTSLLNSPRKTEISEAPIPCVLAAALVLDRVVSCDESKLIIAKQKKLDLFVSDIRTLLFLPSTGRPESPFANCESHGNLIVIQEKNKDVVDDSKWGYVQDDTRSVADGVICARSRI